MDVIPNSHNFYDRNNDKYRKLLNKIKYFQKVYDTNTVTNRYKIFFYDENKKEIFSSYVECFGRLINNWFFWGWANYKAEPRLITFMKRLINYGVDIELTEGIKDDFRVIKELLLQSSLYAEDTFMLDTYCALGMYLIKKELLIRTNNWTNKELFKSPQELYVQNEDPKKDNVDFLLILNPPNLAELDLE